MTSILVFLRISEIIKILAVSWKSLGNYYYRLRDFFMDANTFGPATDLTSKFDYRVNTPSVLNEVDEGGWSSPSGVPKKAIVWTGPEFKLVPRVSSFVPWNRM